MTASVEKFESNIDTGNAKIDACINVWGKPYQTIVAIKSLLEHSGNSIDKIYLILEKNQPDDFDFNIFHGLLIGLMDRVVIHNPDFYLAPNEIVDHSLFIENDAYRHSLRYQYALETSNKQWLLIVHNDVLFSADLSDLVNLLKDKKNFFALGDVGQCWNCPLPPLCDGSQLHNNIKNQPISTDQLNTLLAENQHLRTHQREGAINISNPFPMPECRINEWFMFVNTSIYRDEMSKGNSSPLGAYTWNEQGQYTNDIGESWFREMVQNGYDFQHLKHDPWMIHGPFRGNQNIPQGHNSFLSSQVYDIEEGLALTHYLKHYSN